MEFAPGRQHARCGGAGARRCAAHVPAGFAEDQARFDCGLQTLAQGCTSARHCRRRSSALCGGSRASPRRTPPRWPIPTSACASFTRRAQRHLAVRLAQPDASAVAVAARAAGRCAAWQSALDRISASERGDEAALREACQQMNFWVGGVLATQQDMAALFWARGAERYLRRGHDRLRAALCRLEPAGFRRVTPRRFRHCSIARSAGIWPGSVRYLAVPLLGRHRLASCSAGGNRPPFPR